MDKRFNAAVVSALVLAGAGLFYGVVVYAPGEKPGVPAPSGAQRLALERCEENAMLIHDVRWAAACMVLAEQDEARHAQCLADRAIIGNPRLGKEYCDRTFEATDGSPECTLPDARAASLNALLQQSEEKCVAEARETAP